ncbi:MAG TPA: Rossmann-like and DUF2520 domain-containing protein [Bacteroidota bacterium]|nr:Rossmann-like and DUF2520 domain-containing protein [Bacteroidota bacterium]
MASIHYPRISIIGAGTVGSTLATTLYKIGYPIVSIINRTGQPAIDLAKNVKCKKVSTNIEDVDDKSEIILITVSDGVIKDISKRLASLKKLSFRKLFVAHTSGVHSCEVLESVKKKGALIAAIHPIQSFPRLDQHLFTKSKLNGIYFGLDGDAEALRKAENLVRNLGGMPIVIPQGMKPLYHVLCVFASGYFMVFLNAISELFKISNLSKSWPEVFGPLMTTTMENTVKHSATKALTGPIVRGDISTVDLHLQTLVQHAPQLIPLYTIGGIEMARIAKQAKKISQQDFNQIITHFRKFVKSTSFKKTQGINIESTDRKWRPRHTASPTHAHSK